MTFTKKLLPPFSRQKSKPSVRGKMVQFKRRTETMTALGKPQRLRRTV
jgi:hypothetical protein